MNTLSMNCARLAAVTLAVMTLSTASMAQDSEFDLDDFDDLTAQPEATVADEKAALLDEADAPESTVASMKLTKRVIKTLQRKTFQKIGRTELALGAGLVTNDPFIYRYLIDMDATYHFTEVAALQVGIGYSPDLGQGDWKPITKQIVNNNRVAPDISKIQFYTDLTVQFAPIYGKVAAPGNTIINFDIFGLFGTGLVNTVDDLESLQVNETDPRFAVAQRTQVQWHPTLNYGAGARVVFGKSIALRIEGRGMSFVEVIEGTQLEMKNNVMLLANVSYFLGGSKK